MYYQFCFHFDKMYSKINIIDALRPLQILSKILGPVPFSTNISLEIFYTSYYDKFFTNVQLLVIIYAQYIYFMYLHITLKLLIDSFSTTFAIRLIFIFNYFLQIFIIMVFKLKSVVVCNLLNKISKLCKQMAQMNIYVDFKQFFWFCFIKIIIIFSVFFGIFIFELSLVGLSSVYICQTIFTSFALGFECLAAGSLYITNLILDRFNEKIKTFVNCTESNVYVVQTMNKLFKIHWKIFKVYNCINKLFIALICRVWLIFLVMSFSFMYGLYMSGDRISIFLFAIFVDGQLFSTLFLIIVLCESTKGKVIFVIFTSFRSALLGLNITYIYV